MQEIESSSLSIPTIACPVRLMGGPRFYTAQTAVRFRHRVRVFRLAGWTPPRHGGGAGSSPATPTTRVTLLARRPVLQTGETGSIPVRATNMPCPAESGAWSTKPGREVRLLGGAPSYPARWGAGEASTLAQRSSILRRGSILRSPAELAPGLRSRDAWVRLPPGAPSRAATQTAKRLGPNPSASGSDSLAAYHRLAGVTTAYPAFNR